MTNQLEISKITSVWQNYLKTISDWSTLIQNITPKATGCGPVYELGNLANDTNQSIAIADMRGVKYAMPHYHAHDETEIYIVLHGTGRVVVGGKVLPLEKGVVITTPPDTAHYAIPTESLVLAVINTPPFNPKNNIELSESNLNVAYDHEQFKKLTT